MDARTEKVRSALAKHDVAALLDALGWTTIHVSVVDRAWRAWGWHGDAPDATVVANAPGCRAVVMDGAPRRDLVLAVARHAPLDVVLWFFVSEDELTIAVAQRDAASTWRMRTCAIDCDHPDAVGLDRLLMLDRDAVVRPDELDPAAATAAHLAEVFDAEGLTREFFTQFRGALDVMHVSIVDGPDDEQDRWHAALVVLLRLVFIYFLQREGLLDHDPRWVVRRLRVGLPQTGRGAPSPRRLTAGDRAPADHAEAELRAPMESDDTAFYVEVLRPLFFGVLNTPPDRRDAAAVRLGDVPFLNGGLFEPTPVELAYPGLRWPTSVLRHVIEDVFERFHFTAAEPAGGDEACVVDPEMLGKVFEGLMFGDERRDSGSFYTPRDVVRDMVDTTLDAYVEDRAEDGVDRDAALRAVRILDPAVGTGAFLLEAFASLRRRRAEAGLAVDYAALRTIVHDHLFGVDKNRTAVRLCELRIWLAMLGAMRDEVGPITPLPNLSHRIVAGDSLLDGVALIRRAGGLAPDALAEVMELEVRLEQTQRLFLESHGEAKASHRAEIEQIERALQLRLIEGRRALVSQRLAPLRALEASPDLFGDAMVTTEQQRVAGELALELEHLDDQAVAVCNDRAGAPGFGYETRFGAAAREGFDVIVTNPPWVRAQRVERGQRDALAARYATASGGLWAGARELGIRTPYGAQPDLAALFVERSLELLRPGGRLAALVPAKLFRTLHASPMRRLLTQHRLERVDDLADAQRQLFDAATYPGIVHVRKSSPEDHVVDVRVWRGERCARFRRAARELGPTGRPGEPWQLVPDDVDEVLRSLREHGWLLGEDPALTPRRGVFTGANDVFVRETGGFEREFGAVVRSFVRPMLTGSGLDAAPTSELLWCYDEHGRPHAELPAELEHYFDAHRDLLEQRADYRSGPLWQVFRVREDTCAAKVAWRDMSVLLDPVLIAAGAVPANTVYYVPFEDPDDAAGFGRWMRSMPVRACAHALAEHARGGWRRHFAWVVRMLPIPRFTGGWARFDASMFGLDEAQLDALADWLDLPLQERAA